MLYLYANLVTAANVIAKPLKEMEAIDPSANLSYPPTRPSPAPLESSPPSDPPLVAFPPPTSPPTPARPASLLSLDATNYTGDQNKGAAGTENQNPKEHDLVQVTNASAFKCKGCKEIGAGKRFASKTCNSMLHDFCAQPTLYNDTHPAHRPHMLLFNLSSPTRIATLRSTRCNICGKRTKGYAYICNNASSCKYRMHPCCAKLSAESNSHHIHDAHPLVFIPSSFSKKDSTKRCQECDQIKAPSGGVYACTDRDCAFVIHAVCAKSFVNGLQAHGLGKVDYSKPRSELLSVGGKMVVELFKGIFEGIGEAIGWKFVKMCFPNDDDDGEKF